MSPPDTILWPTFHVTYDIPPIDNTEVLMRYLELIGRAARRYLKPGEWAGAMLSLAKALLVVVDHA